MDSRRVFRAAAAVLLSAAAVSGFAASAPGVGAQAPAPARSLWVWDTAAIRDQPAAQAEFFAFAAAPHGVAAHAITTLYFDGMRAADFQDTVITAHLRQFLSAAHRRRLRVEFLCGDPRWATPERQADGLSYLSAVIAFNRASPPAARYDGFQYDVEPYTLPGWPSVPLENGLVSLLDKSNAAIRASGRPLALSLAIPRWFGQAQFNHLDRRLIDRASEVVVMDYVTTPEQLAADPAEILTYASSVHKAVWIGVETGQLTDTPKSSFYDLGNAAMERELTAAAPQLKPQSSFRGYAVHHYGAYAALRP